MFLAIPPYYAFQSPRYSPAVAPRFALGLAFGIERTIQGVGRVQGVGRAGNKFHTPTADRLGEQVDATYGDDARRRLIYKASFLIQTLIMRAMLANDAALREVIAMACKMVLPATIQGQVLSVIENPHDFPLPHQSTVSRWRVCLDAAFMMYCRQHYPPSGFIRYAMVDSSPQGGRDYELIVVCHVVQEQLPQLVRAANALINLRSI